MHAVITCEKVNDRCAAFAMIVSSANSLLFLTSASFTPSVSFSRSFDLALQLTARLEKDWVHGCFQVGGWISGSTCQGCKRDLELRDRDETETRSRRLVFSPRPRPKPTKNSRDRTEIFEKQVSRQSRYGNSECEIETFFETSHCTF